MEPAVTSDITYPAMRLHVIDALRSLSDRQHQRTRWGRVEDGVNYYDDLSINIHVLYDDCMVLPDPKAAVPNVLHDEEVPCFLELEQALGPMIHDLRDAPDDTYTSDSRWAAVVETAGRALTFMQQLDESIQP